MAVTGSGTSRHLGRSPLLALQHRKQSTFRILPLILTYEAKNMGKGTGSELEEINQIYCLSLPGGERGFLPAYDGSSHPQPRCEA